MDVQRLSLRLHCTADFPHQKSVYQGPLQDCKYSEAEALGLFQKQVSSQSAFALRSPTVEIKLSER